VPWKHVGPHIDSTNRSRYLCGRPLVAAANVKIIRYVNMTMDHSPHVNPQDKCVPVGTPEFFSLSMKRPIPDRLRVAQVMKWWQRLSKNITSTDPIIMPPDNRTLHDDFRQKGLRFRAEDIAEVRSMWSTFIHDFGQLPAPPEELFMGRGIVLIGGRFKYLVPSLVAIKAVRETGCTLPIELWFPSNEPLPKRSLQRLIEGMGVNLRMLPVPHALGQVCLNILERLQLTGPCGVWSLWPTNGAWIHILLCPAFERSGQHRPISALQICLLGFSGFFYPYCATY
jgi:hypothetical protein